MPAAGCVRHNGQHARNHDVTCETPHLRLAVHAGGVNEYRAAKQKQSKKDTRGNERTDRSKTAVRAVFIIDPEGKVRAILYDPLSNGRNMQEVKRLLVAMQHSDQYKIATPANWQLGDDVIVPPPGSCGVAKDRMTKPDPDVKCLDWFMCLKKCPHGK